MICAQQAEYDDWKFASRGDGSLTLYSTDLLRSQGSRKLGGMCIDLKESSTT